MLEHFKGGFTSLEKKNEILNVVNVLKKSIDMIMIAGGLRSGAPRKTQETEGQARSRWGKDYDLEPNNWRMIEVDLLWNQRDKDLQMLLVLHYTCEFVFDYMDGLWIIG